MTQKRQSNEDLENAKNKLDVEQQAVESTINIDY